MSWDLAFVPQAALAELPEWLEQERPPETERARRHGEAVVAAMPELRLAGPFEGAYQLVLDRDDLPLTVDLYGHSAEMNVAYWEGVTKSTAPIVARIAAALAEAGPFVVYDPQDGEPTTPALVEHVFRRQHPRGAKIASSLLDEPLPWYRNRATMLTGACFALLVLHKTGVI